MTPQNFKQYALFKTPSLSHGGSLGAGKRKSSRPLDPKRPVHIVLKATQARGANSLLQPRYQKRIQAMVEETAKRQGLRVYRFTNVGNHLHLLVKTTSRESFQNFLRIITGKIAILVTRAKKGEKKGRFWDGLTFTRVVNWGRDFHRITRYFVKNQIESFGYGTELARELVKEGFVILRSDSPRARRDELRV